jgi:hypothetical protein
MWRGRTPEQVFEAMASRYGDAGVTDQASTLGLPLLTVDGSRPAAQLAADLAERFRLAG